MNINSIFQLKKYPLRFAAVGALFIVMVISAVFLTAPQANAAWGPAGPPGGTDSGSYYTTNGFGWKLFDKNGGGPSGGFRDGTRWGDVQASCAAFSGTGVWIHVIRDPGGRERSYNYQGATWNRNRPAAGADPYVYNAAGQYQYQGASGGAHVISIVQQVQSRFAVEHSAYMSHWGVDAAWFCDGSLENWSSSGTTSANMSSALPGQTIQWTHTLRNNGPTSSSNIYSQTVNSGFSNGTFNGVRNGTNGALGNGGTREHPSYSTYTVQQADVGSNLCQQLQWDPTNSTGGRDGRAANVCVGVPYQYTLTPTITSGVTDGNVLDSTDVPLTVAGTVTNGGPTRSRPNVNWQFTQLEYGVTTPLSSIPNRAGGTNVPAAPCDFFTGEVACDNIGDDTVAAGVGYPGTLPATGAGDLANKPAGTKICFVLSVNPPNASTNNWSHSTMRCIVIGKKPKVQVWAGDLLVGRTSPTNLGRNSGVNTSSSQNGTSFYGSWVEHGIVASGCVSGMASGSGFAGASGATTNLLSNGLSLLTFTSLTSGTCPDNYGNYTHVTESPDVAARFPINVPDGGTEPANPAALPSASVALSDLSGTYQGPAGVTDIAVSGGSDIPVGRRVVINAPGATVRITGDIRYTNDTLRSLSDIPQVVIIANNIVIADTVNQVDAWLVAVGTQASGSGSINTCGENEGRVVNTPLTVNNCNTQLVINGPVIANTLQLRRTAGSDPDDRARPGEIFNLRPDSYLWATGYNLSTGRLSTVQTKELPPRY